MQQQLEERRYINEQIINHQRLLFQIFTFSVIAAVAILGWGMQVFLTTGRGELAAFLLLAPTAIIIPCAFIIGAIRDEIFGWGAYILVFHEDEREPGYETILDKKRDEVEERKRCGRFRESYTSIIGVYSVFILICCSLFFYVILISPICSYFSALVVFPIGLHIWWCIKFYNIPSKEHRDKLKKDWREAKDLLHKSIKQ